MQLLPGFREFPPADCARRNYILTRWREVARRYGFVEYDGPVLEPIELYQKKSGGELVGQLFDFVDKGQRHVTLRPEMTPTLARMVAARHRDYRKPMKWFCVPPFFRYEKQQRGRLREFCQLNCDIIGETSPAADAELIAIVIDMLRIFGFGPQDFVVRLSDRDAWTRFALNRGVPGERVPDLLAVIDKMERARPEETTAKLQPFGITAEEIRTFIAQPGAEAEKLEGIRADLRARGLEEYVELDLTIVRGLAYYTGVVFEVFDRAKSERALAGGGRYDGLIALMSDGKVNLPALGFGMGDVVLANFVQDSPTTRQMMEEWIAHQQAPDVFVVIADEPQRGAALGLVQRLRTAGQRVEYEMTPAKFRKQFEAAEQLQARFAIIVGAEWPMLTVKRLSTRTQEVMLEGDLLPFLASEAARAAAPLPHLGVVLPPK